MAQSKIWKFLILFLAFYFVYYNARWDHHHRYIHQQLVLDFEWIYMRGCKHNYTQWLIFKRYIACACGTLNTIHIIFHAFFLLFFFSVFYYRKYHNVRLLKFITFTLAMMFHCDPHVKLFTKRTPEEHF